MNLFNLFNLLGQSFGMQPFLDGAWEALWQWQPVAGVGKRVAGRAYKEKSHFGMRMMTNFQNIFGHKLKSVPPAQAFASSHLTYSNGLELVGGSTPKPPAYPRGFV